MTRDEVKIIGSAIFGTSTGLIASGNGVLAGAHRAVDLFEFDARSFSSQGASTPQLFFRRAVSGTTEAINLVGQLAACRDSMGRRGFYGACVALSKDSPGYVPGFQDWPGVRGEIEHLFGIIHSFVGVDGSLDYRGGGIEPVRGEVDNYWYALDGDVLTLSNPGLISPHEGLHRLQAVAYAYGTQYPTVILLGHQSEGASSIDHDHVAAALASFKADRASADQQPQLSAQPPEDRRPTPRIQQGGLPHNERSSSTGVRENGRAAPSVEHPDIHELDEIWEAIDELKDHVHHLRKQMYAQSARMVEPIRTPMGIDDAEPNWGIRVAIGLGTLAIVALGIFTAVLLFRSPEADVSAGPQDAGSESVVDEATGSSDMNVGGISSQEVTPTDVAPSAGTDSSVPVDTPEP